MEDGFELIPSNNHASKISVANEFARIVLQNVKVIDKNPKIEQLKELEHQIKGLISNGQYSRAILELNRLSDLKQDIQWYINDRFANHDLLIRDARNCKRPPDFTPEPYIIMGINSIRAAFDILTCEVNDQNKRSPIVDYLRIVINNFYIRTIGLRTEQQVLEYLRQLNSVIAINLAHILEIDVTEVVNELLVAREFANFSSVSKNIVTLITLENANKEKFIAFQGEIALTELTKALSDEYSQRASKKWYQILPERRQRLVDSRLADILQGNRIIPTQLRTILPGLRNSYHAVNGIITGDTFTVTNSVFHSGAIVYLGKDEQENRRICLLNAEQLRQFTQADDILALTLNSNLNRSGNDKKIVKNSQFMMDATNGLYVNLPFNLYRYISSKIIPGIESVFKIVSEKFLKELQNNAKRSPEPFQEAFFNNVTQYLCHGKYPNQQQLEQYYLEMGILRSTLLKNFPEATNRIKLVCEILDITVRIAYLLTLFEGEHLNLTIACELNILIGAMSHFRKIAINSSCESGKDRAGILMFTTAVSAFNRFIFGSYFLTSPDPVIASSIKQNIIQLAYAGHQKFMAGFQCATGTPGIKKDSKSALPDAFPNEAKTALVQETASYNKKLPVDFTSHTRYHFELGNLNLDLQKNAFLHVLKIKLKDLTTQETHANQKFFSFFAGVSTIIAVRVVIEGLIADIPGAQSLKELRDVVIGKVNQTSKLGDVFELLNYLVSGLEKLIAYEATLNGHK